MRQTGPARPGPAPTRRMERLDTGLYVLHPHRPQQAHAEHGAGAAMHAIHPALLAPWVGAAAGEGAQAGSGCSLAEQRRRAGAPAGGGRLLCMGKTRAAI